MASRKTKAEKRAEQQALELARVEKETQEFRDNLNRKQLEFLKVVLELNSVLSSEGKDEIKVEIRLDDQLNSFDVIAIGRGLTAAINFFTDPNDFERKLDEFSWELESIEAKIEERQRKANLVASAKAKLSKEELEALLGK